MAVTIAARALRVFALELLDDLVDDFDLAIAEALVDRCELCRLRFERVQRGEDLSRGDVAAVRDTRDERVDVGSVVLFASQ